MKSFPIGTRVAVYREGAGRITGEVLGGLREVTVKIDGCDRLIGVWPQQCRRLVKTHRRRVWIPADEIGVANYSRIDWGGPKWIDSVEFVEVRKKK